MTTSKTNAQHDKTPEAPFKIVLSYNQEDRAIKAELINLSSTPWLITHDPRASPSRINFIDADGKLINGYDQFSVVTFVDAKSYIPRVHKLEIDQPLLLRKYKFKPFDSDEIRYMRLKKGYFGFSWHPYAFKNGISSGNYSSYVEWCSNVEIWTDKNDTQNVLDRRRYGCIKSNTIKFTLE